MLYLYVESQSSKMSSNNMQIFINIQESIQSSQVEVEILKKSPGLSHQRIFFRSKAPPWKCLSIRHSVIQSVTGVAIFLYYNYKIDEIHNICLSLWNIINLYTFYLKSCLLELIVLFFRGSQYFSICLLVYLYVCVSICFFSVFFLIISLLWTVCLFDFIERSCFCYPCLC